MTDDLQSLHADIAFLRGLAQDGRSAPLLGGSMLVAAGAIFASASVAHWLVASGQIVASPWALPVIWLAALAVFLGVIIPIRRRLSPMKTQTGANRATGMAWQGVGWTIFTLWAAIAIVCWRTHSAIALLLLPSIVLALYGLAWMVAAAMTGKRWIWLTAIGSYAGAVVVAVFAVTPWVFLVFAAALVLLAVVPGVALMRQVPKTV
jgi:hypothetical protein